MAQPYLFWIRDPMVHTELVIDERQRVLIEKFNNELSGPLWNLRNKSADTALNP